MSFSIASSFVLIKYWKCIHAQLFSSIWSNNRNMFFQHVSSWNAIPYYWRVPEYWDSSLKGEISKWGHQCIILSHDLSFSNAISFTLWCSWPVILLIIQSYDKRSNCFGENYSCCFKSLLNKALPSGFWRNPFCERGEMRLGLQTASC